MSTGTPTARPPCRSAMPAAVFAAAVPSRSQTATAAPSAARTSAIASPMPRPAPVTIAVFPCSRTRPPGTARHLLIYITYYTNVWRRPLAGSAEQIEHRGHRLVHEQVVLGLLQVHPPERFGLGGLPGRHQLHQPDMRAEPPLVRPHVLR